MVMPFGLCNSAAVFERQMETIIRGRIYEPCLVYPDDVILIGCLFQEHWITCGMFDFEAHLKLNLEKCKFFQKEVRYLGHIVSSEGVNTDPEKLKAVREWLTPRDKHNIRILLGLCTCYMWFISSLADSLKPLIRLTEKKEAF